MTKTNAITRRSALGLMAGLGFGLGAAAPASAFDPSLPASKALIEAARKEGQLVWYESVGVEGAAKIIAEFEKKFPGVKVQYVDAAGPTRTARILQESLAGGPTADVSVHTALPNMGLAQRDFLYPIDWKSFGVEESLRKTPNQFMIGTGPTVYVLLYNPDRVAEAEVPKTFEDMLDPKWAGKWGARTINPVFITLMQVWGEEKTTKFVESLGKLSPRFYSTPQALTQAVGAGEVSLGYLIPYHTALPTITRGAPVKVKLLEPIPITQVYGYVLKRGRYPNAGRLFLLWLASEDGARAMEAAIGRGDPFSSSTAVGRMVGTSPTVFLDAKNEIDNAARYNDLDARFNRLLTGRGR